MTCLTERVDTQFARSIDTPCSQTQPPTKLREGCAFLLHFNTSRQEHSETDAAGEAGDDEKAEGRGEGNGRGEEQSRRQGEARLESKGDARARGEEGT